VILNKNCFINNSSTQVAFRDKRGGLKASTKMKSGPKTNRNKEKRQNNVGIPRTCLEREEVRGSQVGLRQHFG